MNESGLCHLRRIRRIDRALGGRYCRSAEQQDEKNSPGIHRRAAGRDAAGTVGDLMHGHTDNDAPTGIITAVAIMMVLYLAFVIGAWLA